MTDFVGSQLTGCGELRHKAMSALERTVGSLEVGRTSERQAAEMFGDYLYQYGCDSYWYPAGESVTPSQRGCIVAFDTDEWPDRTAFNNGRVQAASDSVHWQGYGYFYASPQALVAADADSDVVCWGDIGCTICVSSDEELRTAVKAAWDRNQAVIRALEESQPRTTGRLFALNKQESDARGLTNVAWSYSGGNYNIGHDLPLAVRSGETAMDVADIPNRRRFIDGQVDYPLGSGIWTYEARDQMTSGRGSAVQFHEVLTERAGTFHRLPSYERLLTRVGMTWVFE